ncbi:MAG: hypothetical protein FWE45_04045 [Firmicutes bacterium]|nr:hypothetical protein [Bacillota bacterium]
MTEEQKKLIQDALHSRDVGKRFVNYRIVNSAEKVLKDTGEKLLTDEHKELNAQRDKELTEKYENRQAI